MSAREIVAQHYGKNAPDWVIALAQACDETSQNRVAKQVHYSCTVVNQVLRNTYRGNITAVKQAVKGALMDYRVNCPVLGEIHGNVCRDMQRQKFKATNSVRVRLYKACRSGCKHSKLAITRG